MLRSVVLALLVALVACAGSGPLLPGEEEARVRALLALAEEGNGVAQAQLAVHYLEGGGGVPLDAERGVFWIRRAAEEGCPASQTYLGLLHLEGEHVDRSLDEATAWFRRAAELDEQLLRERLALIYGDELPLRFRVAYEWLHDPLGRSPAPPEPR